MRAVRLVVEDQVVSVKEAQVGDKILTMRIGPDGFRHADERATRTIIAAGPKRLTTEPGLGWKRTGYVLRSELERLGDARRIVRPAALQQGEES